MKVFGGQKMNLFMKMTELKDWLNSINFNKDDLTSDDPDTIKAVSYTHLTLPTKA